MMFNQWKTYYEVFIVSTLLGFTSFGGPVAHLGYFHETYVRKRKWIDEKSYMNLVALSQFLPGPASSQVGIGIGVIRAGIIGGIISFIGFTFPSVIILILFALVFNGLQLENMGFIHGLKLVAVAIVAQAIYSMARQFTPDLKRKLIALIALAVILFIPTNYIQLIVIIIAAFIGSQLFKGKHAKNEEELVQFPISKKVGAFFLFLFFAFLILLPIVAYFFPNGWIQLINSLYRSGALVFGGGHVVLPLLEQAFVSTGWMDQGAFLAGYGATQAVPGPLFTFASYIGTVIYGWKGGVVATIAIFLPAFFLIIGSLPFFNQLMKNPKMQGCFIGVNAAVVGILLAAFIHPIWTTTILTITDFIFATVLLILSMYYKLPTWSIVAIGVVGGTIMEFIL